VAQLRSIIELSRREDDADARPVHTRRLTAKFVLPTLPPSDIIPVMVAALAQQPRLLTRDDVEALPENRGVELVDGVLVEKQPVGLEALWIASEILFLLRSQVPKSFAYIINEAMLYPFGDNRNGRRPDCCAILATKFPNGLPKNNPIVVPDLVVEVLSPSDLAQEVEDRLHRYLKAGVPLVWLVNPELRTVRIHRPDGTSHTLEADAEITGEGVLPMFKCTIAKFFPAPLPTSTT
jgi:Uma2 family endonuclease